VHLAVSGNVTLKMPMGAFFDPCHECASWALLRNIGCGLWITADLRAEPQRRSVNRVATGVHDARRFSPSENHQITLSASCICRGLLAKVSWPNVGVPRTLPGNPKVA